MAIIEDNTQAGELPAILCLHGAGTNAAIFRLQARMIIRRLASQFRFIFVDAPFESLPGPGVVPTYVGLEPYLWWHCDETAASEFDISLDEVRRRRDKVRQLLATHLEDPTIVGVMAFSQGARVATGLCLDPKLGQRIKFAILIAATFPALTISDASPSPPRRLNNAKCDYKEETEIEVTEIASDGDSDQSPSCSNPSSDDESDDSEQICNSPRESIELHNGPTKLSIPSVHIQGVADPWISEGTRLYKTYFTPGQSTIVSFPGQHTVPVAKRDVDNVTKAIVAAWDSARSES